MRVVFCESRQCWFAGLGVNTVWREISYLHVMKSEWDWYMCFDNMCFSLIWPLQLMGYWISRLSLSYSLPPSFLPCFSSLQIFGEGEDRDMTDALPCYIPLLVHFWIMDLHSRASKTNTSYGNEVLLQDTLHLHIKTMLPVRNSVPRSSRQSDHMKTALLS